MMCKAHELDPIKVQGLQVMEVDVKRKGSRIYHVYMYTHISTCIII